MSKTTKRKKPAKKVAAKKRPRRPAKAPKIVKPKRTTARALAAGVRYCYLLTADPNWIERCEYGPDGRCNLNCMRIPASEVPNGVTARQR
jgi:hypothetical protein